MHKQIIITMNLLKFFRELEFIKTVCQGNCILSGIYKHLTHFVCKDEINLNTIFIEIGFYSWMHKQFRNKLNVKITVKIKLAFSKTLQLLNFGTFKR